MKDKKGIGLEFAWRGIMEAIKLEKNFRIHLIVMSVVIILGFIFKLEAFEWIFIILAIQFVLVTELLNSIFERVLDYLNMDYHPQIKIMKDMSAGVVLLSAICSIIIGLIVFIPKFILLF